MPDSRRLAMLDGYRALAIFLVIGYHYFVRWTPPEAPENLYPYGGLGAHVWPFRYGYLGVELFFMVSGFVISMTLFRSRNALHFAQKRFARLFPSMLLCSVLTFAVLWALPQQAFHPHLRDFAPSLTFTDPVFWSRLFGRDFAGVDGSYWSLFVEAKFYFWICLLYFSIDSRHFFNAAAMLLAALTLATAGAHLLHLPHPDLPDTLFAISSLPWFAAGIGFYALYAKRGSRTGWWLLAASALSLSAITFGQSRHPAVPLLAMAVFDGLFLLMLYRPGWLSWLASRPVAAVGVASYSLYLLHQDIGVAVLSVSRTVLNAGAALPSTAIAAGVALALTVASLLIYRYWEVPARALLLRRPWDDAKRTAPGGASGDSARSD